MTGDTTVILGIEIPSTDPVFITVIMGIHVPLGLACVVAGAAAMLSEKRRATIRRPVRSIIGACSRSLRR